MSGCETVKFFCAKNLRGHPKNFDEIKMTATCIRSRDKNLLRSGYQTRARNKTFKGFQVSIRSSGNTNLGAQFQTCNYLSS